MEETERAQYALLTGLVVLDSRQNAAMENKHSKPSTVGIIGLHAGTFALPTTSLLLFMAIIAEGSRTINPSQ
jgi:hypothetical protein